MKGTPAVEPSPHDPSPQGTIEPRSSASSPNFRIRSYDEELLDDPSIDRSEVERALRELDVINRWLGGYKTSLTAIERCVAEGCSQLSILDVGCGGGDFSRQVMRWGAKRNIEVRVVGIDLSAVSIDFARRSCGAPGAEFRQQDLFDLQGVGEFDVVHSCLVLHHLDDEHVRAALCKMHQLARCAVVVNDLHRHPVAYHSIKWITAQLLQSRLVRNDAALSVLRGFSRSELEALSGDLKFELSWKWAFRWQWVATVERTS